MVLWSKTETETLNKLWPDPRVTKQNLLKIFPKRSWDSIANKAKSMPGLNSFTSYRRLQINREYYKELMRIIDVE